MKTVKSIESKDSIHVSSHSYQTIDFNIVLDQNNDLDAKDLIGCHIDCQCCSDTQSLNGWCECSLNRCGVETNYDKNGLLINWRKPIYECGDNCSCSTSSDLNIKCGNRWTQRPTECLTQVFFDSAKGYCIRTENDLKCGQFVVEYCGEVIDTIDAKHRFQLYSSNSEEHNYILVFREHFGNESTFETIIDAKYYANESRLISHSCEPNLTALPVRSDSLRPRICLFAAQDIVGGTELSYNYGSDESLLSSKLCFCGSDNCRRFMPSDLRL